MPNPTPRSLFDRFMEKVSPEPFSGCWIWNASSMSNGYGHIGGGPAAKGAMVLAHRVSYELFKGPIPEGLHIDHLCGVRPCVNPAHLEAVTMAENMKRMGASITHCRNGHLFTSENTYRAPGSGDRSCVTCRRKSERAYYKRKFQKAA